MSAYYNEWEPYQAQWLRNLIAAGHIAPGDVDERSITEVQADDLRGYTQCHFFAGIGGWSYALRLAGWPDDRPVWTGSCPCQPFSSASRGLGKRLQSNKHLWPAWSQFIQSHAPAIIFGEQVASAGDWFDEVCDDLDRLGYAYGAAILPAASIGKDHARARLYFGCYANCNSKPSGSKYEKTSGVPKCNSFSVRVQDEDGLPHRMDALRAYGNAIVPQIAQAFIEAFVECQP